MILTFLFSKRKMGMNWGEYDKNNKIILNLIKRLEKTKTEVEFLTISEPIRRKYDIYSQLNHTLQLVCNRKFYDAIKEKNHAVLDFFMARNIRPEDRALFYCIRNKHNKLFKFLFTKYQPFNHTDEHRMIFETIRYNNKKLFYFFEKNIDDFLSIIILKTTVGYNNPEFFFYLLEKGVPLLKSKIFVSNAVPAPGESTEILRFLISRGFDVNRQAAKALMMAIRKDNLEVIKLLVSERANVHMYGNKIIKAAIWHSSIEIIEFLLSLGLELSKVESSAVESVISRGSDEVFRLLVTGYKHPETQKFSKVTLKKRAINMLKSGLYPTKSAIFREVCG